MRQRLLSDVRDLKERPSCRDFIVQGKFVPDILQHGGDKDKKLVWDGMTSRTPDGIRRIFAVPYSVEMKRLAANGFWGDLSNVSLDIFRYSRIRDELDGKGRGDFIDAQLWQPPKRNSK
jgi:hypothetical protein